MDWDMLLVAGALIGVLMLVALLGRIWRDPTLPMPVSGTKASHEFAAPAGEVDRVAE
jgi:hypothetical protein